MYSFGSGVLIGTPAGANQTPVNFGLIQDATFDETGTLKPLFGQYRRPLAIGAGTMKSTLKAKTARISGLMMSSLYYGVALSAGQKAAAIGEAGTVPGAPAYTVTVANSATWVADQGVIYATTGLPLKEVAAGPTVGQYSVAAGVYTFAAADANALVLISYDYTIAGSGKKFTINNPLLGTTVNFSVLLYTLDPTTGLSLALRLYSCTMSKASFGTKLEDWMMPDWEAECAVNAANSLGEWNFPDSF